MLAAVGAAGMDGHAEREYDARDGGVHARVVEQDPRDDREREEDHPGRRVVLLEQPFGLVGDERVDRDDGDCREEVHELRFLRVEDRDDEDGDEVVDNGEGEEEGAQGGGKLRADQGEHRNGERNVGRGGNRPSVVGSFGTTEVHERVDDCGYRDATGRGEHRHEGKLRVAQVATHELVLELEAYEEEEHGEETVGCPVCNREVEVQPSEVEAEVGVADGEVEVRERGVRADEREDRRDDESNAARRFLREDFFDAAVFAEGSLLKDFSWGARFGRGQVVFRRRLAVHCVPF